MSLQDNLRLSKEELDAKVLTILQKLNGMTLEQARMILRSCQLQLNDVSVVYTKEDNCK